MLFKKRGGISISVNVIIIIILAIVFLGLGIFFIQHVFGKGTEIVKMLAKEPEPSQPTKQNPITLSKQDIETSAGKTEVIRLKALNPTEQDWIFRDYIDPSLNRCGNQNDNVCYVDKNNFNCDEASKDSDCPLNPQCDTNMGNSDGICYIDIDNCPFPLDIDCNPTEGVTLRMDCSKGIAVNLITKPEQIKSGEVKEFAAVMKISENAKKGTYVCRISIEGEDVASYGTDIIFKVS